LTLKRLDAPPEPQIPAALSLDTPASLGPVPARTLQTVWAT